MPITGVILNPSLDFGVLLSYRIAEDDDWNRDGCLRIKRVLASGKFITFRPKIETNVCGCSHNACKTDTGYQEQNTREFCHCGPASPSTAHKALFQAELF